jgi:ABC-type nitrate/sulfonate/bicarbonate transport system substrate-binding protein
MSDKGKSGRDLDTVQRTMRNVLLKVIPLYVFFSSAFCAAAEQVMIATPSQGLYELPVVVAMRNGYFRTEGLEVQKIQIQPEIAVKALLAGEVGYVSAWGASVQAAMTGAPIKVVAAMVSRPMHVLISRPEIRVGRDLKGKTLGVDSFDSRVDYLSRLAVRYLGLDPDRGGVKIIDTGESLLRVAALKDGSIDATAVDVALAVKAEEGGLKRLLHLGDIIDLPVSGIAVTSAKLATHGEQIKKVIQATLRGARFIKQKRPETIRIIQSHLRITLSQATKTYDSSIRFFTDDGFVSERAVALDVRRAKEELQLATEPSLSQVTDWSLLREIKLERSKIPYWLKHYEP